MSFWETLDQLCKTHNTSATSVVLALGMSKGNITRWKNNTLPNSDILMKLADYFSVSTDYLLGRESEKISLDNELAKVTHTLPPEKIKALIETAKAMK